MSLLVYRCEVTPLQQNCRVLVEGATKRCVVIDPGGDAQILKALLTKEGLSPEAIWLTHSHFDHCGGAAELKRDFDIPLYAHPGETYFRTRVLDSQRLWQIPGKMENCPEPDHSISGGETLSIGDERFSVLFTPGHAPGHLCFYSATGDILIAGDTIFFGSMGRTDLPFGDTATLFKSIREKLLVLPSETRVLSGHGPDTTIGAERLNFEYLNQA